MKNYKYTINGELQAIITAKTRQDAYAVAVHYYNAYQRKKDIQLNGCKLTEITK